MVHEPAFVKNVRLVRGTVVLVHLDVYEACRREEVGQVCYLRRLEAWILDR